MPQQQSPPMPPDMMMGMMNTPNRAGFFARAKYYLTTTNHKDIGTLYLWFAFTMFISGGIMALLIRSELFQPGLQIVEPEFFNQLTTMHGLVMVFGAIMPAFTGFANWQVPMMVGACDMAFARLNNWSFWLLPVAALLLIGSFFTPSGRRRRVGRYTHRFPSSRVSAWTWPFSPFTSWVSPPSWVPLTSSRRY